MMSTKKSLGKIGNSLKGFTQILQNVTEKAAAADREKKKPGDSKKRPRQAVLGSRSQPAASATAALPIGAQLRAVVEFAKEKRRELTYSEVFVGTKVNIEGNSQLVSALQRNEVVSIDPNTQTLRYRTKYSINSLTTLHDLIRRNPFGINSNDLKDAYPEAGADLQQLVNDQAVFQCHSRDYPDVYIVFPNDINLVAEVDEDMRTFLQSIEMPQESTQIDAALLSAGIKKAKRSTARLKLTVITDNQPKNKKRKQTAIRHVTNLHMPELFQGEMATQIDG